MAGNAAGPSAWLDRPRTRARAGVVLAHGAGSDAGNPLLVALAERIVEAGMLALRIDLAFRRLRPRGLPRREDAPADRAAIARAVAALRVEGARRIALAGHSYGARQSSLLAAEAPGLADALVLLAYPLHPPRQPLALRTDHFPSLTVPVTFIHGTRDPFGSPEELEAARRLVPTPTELVVVEGAGHDLALGRGAGREPAVAALDAAVGAVRTMAVSSATPRARMRA